LKLSNNSNKIFNKVEEENIPFTEKRVNVRTASLYIHIPFCNSLCDYCDFFSVPIKKINDDYIDFFIAALIKDIKNQINFFNIKDIPSVYTGGGTPSVLGKKIKTLLDALNKLPNFSPREFTVEANPESITSELFAILRGEGVNRLSLGIQTFNQKSRLAVNRTGDTYGLEDRLSLASKYFKGMLSVDLITGLPYQNTEIILNDIKRVLSYDVSHISLYSLTIENGTPLYENINKKIVTLPDSDFCDSLWLTGRDALLEAGFDHYEVSNFARHGKQCLHNVRYWQMKSWMGAGPSASGTIIDKESPAAWRYTYPEDMDKYLESIKTTDSNRSFKNIIDVNKEVLDNDVLLRESLLMGFRYKNGPDKKLFKKRFGITIEECIPQTLKKWKGKNKLLFLNGFLCDAFSELDRKQLIV